MNSNVLEGLTHFKGWSFFCFDIYFKKYLNFVFPPQDRNLHKIFIEPSVQKGTKILLKRVEERGPHRLHRTSLKNHPYILTEYKSVENVSKPGLVLKPVPLRA